MFCCIFSFLGRGTVELCMCSSLPSSALGQGMLSEVLEKTLSFWRTQEGSKQR